MTGRTINEIHGAVCECVCGVGGWWAARIVSIAVQSVPCKPPRIVDVTATCWRVCDLSRSRVDSVSFRKLPASVPRGFDCYWETLATSCVLTHQMELLFFYTFRTLDSSVCFAALLWSRLDTSQKLIRVAQVYGTTKEIGLERFPCSGLSSTHALRFRWNVKENTNSSDI